MWRIVSKPWRIVRKADEFCGLASFSVVRQTRI